MSWKHLWVYKYGYPCQFGRVSLTMDVVQYLKNVFLFSILEKFTWILVLVLIYLKLDNNYTIRQKIITFKTKSSVKWNYIGANKIFPFVAICKNWRGLDILRSNKQQVFCLELFSKGTSSLYFSGVLKSAYNQPKISACVHNTALSLSLSTLSLPLSQSL